MRLTNWPMAVCPRIRGCFSNPLRTILNLPNYASRLDVTKDQITAVPPVPAERARILASLNLRNKASFRFTTFSSQYHRDFSNNIHCQWNCRLEHQTDKPKSRNTEFSHCSCQAWCRDAAVELEKIVVVSALDQTIHEVGTLAKEKIDCFDYKAINGTHESKFEGLPRFYKRHIIENERFYKNNLIVVGSDHPKTRPAIPVLSDPPRLRPATEEWDSPLITLTDSNTAPTVYLTANDLTDFHGTVKKLIKGWFYYSTRNFWIQTINRESHRQILFDRYFFKNKNITLVLNTYFKLKKHRIKR